MPTPHASCPYCATDQPLERVDPLRRMSGCRACGAWFVWPTPTLEQIAAHYAQADRGMPRELREWREGTSQHGWYERLARTIRQHAQDGVRSVVDIGAGGLELTLALASAFPDARVEGWDLFPGEDEVVPRESRAARIELRRLDLNRLDRLAPQAHRFDVVACVAVIEHVLDPLALLHFIRALTAPDGLAYIVGPDVGSIARKLMGRRWPYYSPDDHLTIPTLDSMSRAVVLAGGGHCELRRINVHYSLRYLLRFLRVPVPLPDAADLLVPIPAGAFELVWRPK